VELEYLKDDFRKQGLGIVAISHDSQEILREFAEQKHITFSLLSDVDSEVIKRFGILNHNIPKDNPNYGIPFPGQYIVNQHGVVRAKYFENNHRERVTMESVLIRSTDWSPGSLGKIETNEIILEYTAGKETVHPGNHITLILNVYPKNNMHIYAPGVKSYIPITWELNQSDLYKGGPVEFAKAEMLELAVIGEKVPVYRKSFRVLQDVEISQKPILDKGLGDISKKPELVIEGTLKYQACDDKICYIPKNLKLKFVFNVEEHDWIRTKARRESQ